jgi:cGMP-dependent protein kinase
MGYCLPNNRGYDLIKYNISQKELKSGTKIFDVRTDDDADDDNNSKKSQNENKNKGLINNINDTNNNNIKSNSNNNKNAQTLKLAKNQPITTNINNINININQISKNSEITEKNNNNENESEKIVKAVLNIEEKQNLKEIFSNHFLFKNKSNQLILSIIDSLEMMFVKKDETLFKQGDKGYYFYVIKEGKIELVTEYGLKTLNENDTFGELALIQNKKRTASAKALENCKLLLLNGKKFREIISEKTETDFKERMNILSASPIFSSLDNNKLNALASGLICCSFEPNQKILYKGDIGQSIYIIKTGKVKCLNGEREIRFLGPKDYFGEGSILFNMNRSLTIHVEETTECYQLSESFLIETLGKDFKQEIVYSISKNAFYKSPIMKSFSNPVYFQKIIENCTIKSYEDNEVILKKDEDENYKRKLYVLLSGNLIEKETTNIVASRGELYGDVILKYNKFPKYTIIGVNGVKLVEFEWDLIIDKFGLGLNSKKIFSLFSKVENLRNISLFKETPTNKLVDIVKLMKKKAYKKDQVIFREGEVGDILYMIKKGTVHIFKDKKQIREYGQGVCFGEIALLYNEPRTATAISVCDSSIYCLTKNDFKTVLDDNMVSYLMKKMALEDSFNTSLDNLYYVKSLGHGKFGDVSLVHNDKTFFAIKAVNRKAAEKQKILIKYYIQERAILLGLQHPFIMKLVKTFKREDKIFFLLEYICGRTMNNYLNSRTSKQIKNFKETIFYLATLFVAVDYLNSRNICHRDLKPDNIIIDERGYLKIIDFGNSITLNGFTNTMTGTPHYMAPEILLRGGYGFSCDYWSIGIIAYQTYYDKYPFGDDAKDPIEVYKEVIKKKLVFKSGDQKMIQLIKSLLTKKVAERICSLEKAKELDAFENFNWDDLLDFKIVPQYIPKKVNLKEFSEYRKKYIKFLEENNGKSEGDTLFSSYEDDDDIPYDENWADVF